MRSTSESVVVVVADVDVVGRWRRRSPGTTPSPIKKKTGERADVDGQWLGFRWLFFSIGFPFANVHRPFFVPFRSFLFRVCVCVCIAVGSAFSFSLLFCFFHRLLSADKKSTITRPTSLERRRGGVSSASFFFYFYFFFFLC